MKLKKRTIKQIKLVIESRLDNVSLIGKSIKSLCLSLSYSENESYDIETCVVEAVNNAIKHAYHNQSDKEVEVIFSIHEDKIVIEICDTGKQMEWKNFPMLNFNHTDLNDLPEGGMGLYIIHSIMDKMDYYSHNHKNILSITRFLPKSSLSCQRINHILSPEGERL
jgi:serine/threonine-protein kinase RsbW